MNMIKYFLKLESTSQKLKELVKEGAAPWTAVVAKEQTAGHGKEKRFWHSPEGGLYFSIALPESQIDDLQTLTILAAFIVAKTIKENFNLEPFIKLPNDVYLNQKKVCGILTENIIGNKVKFSIMGIGLNTNIDKMPKDLENTATSLKIELGREVDNEEIIKTVIKELKEQLKTISQ